MVAVNTTLAAALFVTALCGRYFGAGHEPDEDLIAPWPRLAKMIEGLGPKPGHFDMLDDEAVEMADRKSTRLNSSHTVISYAVFCLKKKKYRIFLASRCLL